MAISLDVQWVTIANRALLRIAQKALTSLDDGSSAADYANQQIPQALDEVYSAHPWRDELKRAQLVPLADAPVFGYLYAFALPSNFSRIKSVETLEDEPWALENGVIVTDSVSVNIVYTKLPEVPDDMSPTTRTLVVKLLSYLLSIPLTKNNNMQNRLYEEYNRALSMAITNDNRVHHEEDISVEWYDSNR
jgi:hypothetical protein